MGHSLIRSIAVCFALVSMQSFGYAQGPPILTDTPITLGLQGRGVRTFAKVTRTSGLGQRITSAAWPVAVPFNLTTDGVAGLVVPTVFKRVNKGGSDVSSSGIGDVSVFAKYVVYQLDRPRETFRFAPKVVLKFPTGDPSSSPSLGSGTTDFSFGGVAAWLKGRAGVYAESLYQIIGERDNRDQGNGLAYNFAVAWRLAPAVYETYPARQWNGYLELNGLWKSADRVFGTRSLDSGGHVLYLSPGIQFIPVRRFLAELSLQAPVVTAMNGNQPEPDWSVLAGVRVLMF